MRVQIQKRQDKNQIESDYNIESLIALALIMSLLQLKPARMYILDEIDAALELSHTQHIGRLFCTRFKGNGPFISGTTLA